MTEKDKALDSQIGQEQNMAARQGSVWGTLRRVFTPVLKAVGSLFNTIFPPYDPRIDLGSKLVEPEQVKDKAVIIHFSELQVLLAIVLLPLGFVIRSYSGNGLSLMVSILGFLLLFTAYELEEIVITTHRIMVRRIGMVERVLRIPSDEEHALKHLVSIQVGRAPVNTILLLLSLPGFFILFGESADLVQLLVVLASTVILLFALRINRRAVTLHLAGGLNIVMGIRKGVPKGIISSIQQAIYEGRPFTVRATEDVSLGGEYFGDEKAAKDLDEI